MAGMGFAPCRTMAAEDIRDLQCQTRHGSGALGRWFDPLDLAGDMLQRAHDLLSIGVQYCRPNDSQRKSDRNIECPRLAFVAKG